ncbi:MAG: right-handed parallel beta-helix repeat-containing protein [Nibricoccus sp.]
MRRRFLRHPFFALTFALLISASPSSATAKTLTVNRQSAIAGQYTSIQSAIDAAKPGDVIKISPGLYRERLTLKHRGEPSAPLTIEGESGVILDGSSEVTLNWIPASEIAPGVYRTSVDFVPFTVVADDGVITTIDEKRTDPALPHSERDNLRWPQIFKDGVGPSGWKGVRAVAMYRHKGRDLLIRFEHERDPRTMSIVIAPREPVIRIIDSSHCVIRGLQLQNSAFGILAENTSDLTIEHCVIKRIDYGIHIGRGSARCLIRYNEISYDPYAGSDFRRPGQWDAWVACKNAGFYDRYAVRIAESDGHHEVHDNFVHDHWDGIQSGFPGTPEQNSFVRVHHNRLLNIFDDALETSGGQTNSQWHDNIIEHARCACRIKDAQSGPLYIYRNLFLDNGEDLRNWASAKGPAPVTVWVYHNTTTSDAAVTMNYPAGAPISTPHYHFVNNLHWCRTWVAQATGTGAKYPLPDWQGDHNVFVRKPAENSSNKKDHWADGVAMAEKAGLDRHSIWITDSIPGFVDGTTGNLALKPDSPARSRGQDLRPFNLPGISIDASNATHPDAGALQFGEPMPKLPRSPAPR